MSEVASSVLPLKGIFSSGKFIKNWAYLLTSSVFSQALGMFAMIRIARILAPAGYGYYSLFQTTAGIGMVLAGFGMRHVIIRDGARNPENIRVLYEAGLVTRFLFGIIVALGVMLYSMLSLNALPTPLRYLAVVILFGQIAWDTTESISFGLQRMEYSSWVGALGSVLWVLWIWCAPASMLTVLSVSFSFTLLQLIKSGVLDMQVRKIAPRASGVNNKNLHHASRRLIIDSLPFYWLALMTMVQNQLPILMLAERSSFEQVGLFNISFRLLIPLQLLVNTGLSVLYPYLSQLKIQNAAKYIRATENALKMIVVVGSGFALLISLFRIEVVKILFGAKYVGASDAVALQCWYTVFYAVLCLIGTSLAATDKQHWLAALTTFYTIVALPIIWLGTAHGATGLAAGMAIGGFINLTYHWYYFRKSLPGKLQSRSIVHLFIILGGAVLGSWIFPEDNSIALKAIIASAVIVFGGIALLKTWEQLRHAP